MGARPQDLTVLKEVDRLPRLFFNYSVVISAPSRGLTQTVTQTRKRPGRMGWTQWIAHRVESTQKGRKALDTNAFRPSSYLHTQEVTGSSPAVSTRKKPWNRNGSEVFSFLMQFVPSFCGGQNVALCSQMLPCFRSQAVLSCTAFVLWEPYKYLRLTVMSSDNIGSICCNWARTASALRFGV